MGTYQHDAMIITFDRGFDPEVSADIETKLEQIDRCADEADLGHLVTGPTLSMNGLETLFVAPDGSKEGWQDSNAGDTLRNDIAEIVSTFPAVEIIYVTWGELKALSASTEPINTY